MPFCTHNRRGCNLLDYPRNKPSRYVLKGVAAGQKGSEFTISLKILNETKHFVMSQFGSGSPVRIPLFSQKHVRPSTQISPAASAPEAVKLYLGEGERISLIILDVIMPEMGGDECLEEILAINPDARIIVSSGAVVDGKKNDTLESGAKGFVSKPFQLREMLKTVREVVDKG
jgi:CheY-like chemotaxis protein